MKFHYLHPYQRQGKIHFQKKEFKDWKKQLWDVIKYTKLSNQIIENHKIVNFKEANYEYKQLVENDCEDEASVLKLWLDLIKEPMGLLHKSTDGVLRKEKQKRIIQNG